MIHLCRLSAVAGFGLLCGAPVWAGSLSTIGPAQPIPAGVMPADSNATELTAAEISAAGSTTLEPLMAADVQARTDADTNVDAPAGGGAPAGKPIDDTQFVRQATESGRKEIRAAQDALPQLKDPELKRI